MPEYKPARFRRMLAWFLDLGICLMLPGRLVTVLPLSANVQIFAAAFAIFGGLAAFLCRDYLLGGRSIGKRILGLSVVDRQTGEAVTGGRLVLRNLFFFLYPVDGGFLLFSGRSLGERTTNTRVIRARNHCEIRVKPFLIVGGIAAAIALAFGGLIFGVMKLAQGVDELLQKFAAPGHVLAVEILDPGLGHIFEHGSGDLRLNALQKFLSYKHGCFLLLCCCEDRITRRRYDKGDEKK